MKIKIVNKKKFMRSTIVLTCLLILFIFGITCSYSKTKLEYKESYVSKGETLWSIAENEINTNTYYKNKDIRNVISEIKRINNLNDGNLKIGQKILIPVM